MKEYPNAKLIVSQTNKWVEKLEKKTTLNKLNALLDEINTNPLMAELL